MGGWEIRYDGQIEKNTTPIWRVLSISSAKNQNGVNTVQ